LPLTHCFRVQNGGQLLSDAMYERNWLLFLNEKEEKRYTSITGPAFKHLFLPGRRTENTFSKPYNLRSVYLFSTKKL
jgi:hypothetical protein